MRITLKKLELKYFKGIKNLKLEFHENQNSIFGENGSGKSTIADSVSWVIFGKNSAGESDTKFNIKTLDENNVAIPKVDHSVEAWLMVGDEEVVLKRVLREKWVKERGALETTFKGNETVYFWNNVPKTQKEYQEKISQILDETVFKMITDPLAFNGLHWEKSREILVSIAGNIENEDVAKGNKDFAELLEKLKGNKTLEEYVKELAAERLRLNKEIKYIPTRIDEATKSKPEEADWAGVEKKKSEIEAEITKVDGLIEDRNKAVQEASDKRQETSNKIFELKTRNQNIEFEEKQKINSVKTPDPLGDLPSKLETAKSNLNRYESAKASLDHSLSMDEQELEGISKKKDELSKDWDRENSMELKFKDDCFVCPTCERQLEADDIEAEKEKMTKEFNLNKQNGLQKINEAGQKVAEREKMLQGQIKDLKERIKKGDDLIVETKKEVEKITKEIEVIKSKPSQDVESPESLLDKALKSNKEYQTNIKTIVELETKLQGNTGFDVSDLRAQKSTLTADLDEVKEILSKKDRITEIDARVKELNAEEKKLGQEIANIEKMQFVAHNFTTTKINMLEENINKLFTGVSFKMFKEQIDGVIPWCYCLVNGVPFSDVNTAGKINAGLAIINVLSKHYNVSSPVFIDNRESVIDLIPTDSQIINLIVSKEDKTLRIV